MTSQHKEESALKIKRKYMAENQLSNKQIKETIVDKVFQDEVTWQDLGLVDVLCNACMHLQWKAPTPIQCKAIPPALQGQDIVGLAETGSGKTAAFALPILQTLLRHPQRLFALILTPTRELAEQIAEQFNRLGSDVSISTAILVGGLPKATQAIQLAHKPHIIIATPGRLVDHLETTKGFDLSNLKHLVLDEADRILSMDFEAEVNKILEVIPRERNTMLFSATMTKQVNKLRRASLRQPVFIKVSGKFQTVSSLKEYYLFIPYKHFDIYLVHLLNEIELRGSTSFVIFCLTCDITVRLALILRSLGFSAISLHGQMSQSNRQTTLSKFKTKDRKVLVCTDVASRGLDIPHVDAVINFGVPLHSKDYIHRVGRTARAGRFGKAITLVSERDVDVFERLEKLLGKELQLYKVIESDVMTLKERVIEARRLTDIQLTKMNEKEKKRKMHDEFTSEQTKGHLINEKCFKRNKM